MSRVIESAGVHVLIDAFVNDPLVFTKETLANLFVDLVSALDMDILVGPNFVEVPMDPEVLRQSRATGVFRDEGGITGTCIISKSHISIHAWPLQKFFSFDVFSCGDFDPQVAIDLVHARLGVCSANVTIIGREKPVDVQPSVYCLTNKVNGKRYVGKSKDPASRWGMHVWLSKHPDHKAFSLVHSAMAKYGEGNFMYETLEICENEKEAYEQEKVWVARYRSNERGYGYNLTPGGDGITLSDEARAKRAATVKTRSAEGAYSGENAPLFGLRGSDHPAYGSKRSQDFKRQLSEARKGPGNPMFGREVKPENRLAKSRAWLGSGNPNKPKFSTQDVAEVKALQAKGLTQREMAQLYKVSQSVISKMLNGKYRTKDG